MRNTTMFCESFEKYCVRFQSLAMKNSSEMRQRGLEAGKKVFDEFWLTQRKAQVKLANFLFTLDYLEKLPKDVKKGMSALCEFNR